MALRWGTNWLTGRVTLVMLVLVDWRLRFITATQKLSHGILCDTNGGEVWKGCSLRLNQFIETYRMIFFLILYWSCIFGSSKKNTPVRPPGMFQPQRCCSSAYKQKIRFLQRLNPEGYLSWDEGLHWSRLWHKDSCMPGTFDDLKTPESTHCMWNKNKQDRFKLNEDVIACDSSVLESADLRHQKDPFTQPPTVLCD